MKTTSAFCLAFALFSSTAFAARPAPSWPSLPPGDEVFRAMKDEMTRSMARLRMDALQKPYALSYTVREGRHLGVSASFGAEESYYSYPYRRLRTDLRVGSPAFDNSNYTPSKWDGYRAENDMELPFEAGGYDGLRYSLWSATDKAYKKALETYSKKKAYKEARNISELFDDLTPEAPYELYLDTAAAAPDEAAWRETVRRVSAVFRGYPSVKYSKVVLNFDSAFSRFMNSGGSAFRQPVCSGRLTIEAKAYAPDGFLIENGAAYAFCLPGDAPSETDLIARAKEIGEALSGTGRSSQPAAYIGPVLFDREAAGEFFDHFLAKNISNPREVWTTPDRWSSDPVFRRAGELVERLGMRVLSPFLTAVDDPGARYYGGKPLTGAFAADDEGVPARKMEIVAKGKLLSYFMSRAATRDFKVSNGRGRAGFEECPSGAPSNLFVKAEEGSPRAVPQSEMKARLLALCREQELEYCLLVKGGLNDFSGPFAAYKVFSGDGREEPVHGMEFTGAGLRALRDISAVSKELFLHYPDRNPPVSIIAPSALVQEMEIKKTGQKPEKKPYLPHPYFSEGKTP